MRLLVVRRSDDGRRLVPVEHDVVLTRLGEGLGDTGAFAPEAVARTLAVVERYVVRIRSLDAEAIAIATSAMRRAADAESVRARFLALAGIPLRVLEGRDEARLSYAGATYGTAPRERTAVLDIGGGSTECAAPDASGGLLAASVEIGAVRLTEAHPELAGLAGPTAAAGAAARARALVGPRLMAAFSAMRSPRVPRLIAVAGTPQTIAAIDRPGGDVEGRDLTDQAAAAVEARLIASPLEVRRRMPGMVPERADILLAGLILYRTALRVLGASGARVTRNDLLLGALAEEA